MQTNAEQGLPCDACGAACCRYLALEIDRPNSKRAYDQIRWFLLHEGVHVFRDRAGRWFLETENRCSKLGRDGRCKIYASRPRICREHGEGGESCEFAADDLPHTARFSSASAFEAYLDARSVDWRWKERKRGSGTDAVQSGGAGCRSDR